MTSKRTPKTQASTQRLEEDQQVHRRPRRARVGKPKVAPDRPRVNLALQGGGSHGAFTWGVIDRLLELDGLDFGGISGTSAGALNGAVMLTGYVKGHQAGDWRRALAEHRQTPAATGGGNARLLADRTW